MRSGEVIRLIRKAHGDTRKDLAWRAGISEDYLKKIETGKRQLTNVVTLRKLADALGVNMETLLYEDEALVMAELSRRGFMKASLAAGVGVLTAPAIEFSQEEEISPRQISPEAWIVRGDTADGHGQWSQALEFYHEAIKLVPKDYRWARWLVEKVAQMHINQGAFLLAKAVFSEVEASIEEWGTDVVNRDLIVGLIAEKRGWIRNFQGQHDLALEHFRQALEVARRWGDIRLESTSHHFLGRSAVEGQSQLLYPEILPPRQSDPHALASALAELRQAEDFDRKSDPNVGFDLQWQSQALLLLGQYEDAKKLLQRSIRLLYRFAETDPLIESARIQTWEARSQREYDGITESLSVLLEAVAQGGHPYSFVRAILAFLSVRYLAEYYRRSRVERRRCVDLCVISMLLHYEPEHTYFTVTNELLDRFIQAMDDKEFANYLHELPARIVQYSDDFQKLTFFPLPTLAVMHAVLDVLYAIGFKQGKQLQQPFQE